MASWLGRMNEVDTRMNLWDGEPCAERRMAGVTWRCNAAPAGLQAMGRAPSIRAALFARLHRPWGASTRRRSLPSDHQTQTCKGGARHRVATPCAPELSPLTPNSAAPASNPRRPAWATPARCACNDVGATWRTMAAVAARGLARAAMPVWAGRLPAPHVQAAGLNGDACIQVAGSSQRKQLKRHACMQAGTSH